MVEMLPEIHISDTEAVDHSDYLMLISMALDGMLGAEEKERLDRHLEGCSRCRVQWLLWQVIDQKLRAAPTPAPVQDIPHLVMERLARQERRRNMQVGLALTVLTVFVWALGLAGASVLACLLVYTNLGWFASSGQFLTDAWAVAGVVGVSLWEVIIELTATPTALGAATAYLFIAAAALAAWLLLIQRSMQPVRRMYRGWTQSPS